MLLTQTVRLKLRNFKKDILTQLRRLSKNIFNLISNMKEIQILSKQRGIFLDTGSGVSPLAVRVLQITQN